MGLGLPAGDQDPQAQALRPLVHVRETERAVGVHDRGPVAVHREIPLIGGHVVQRLPERFARALVAPLASGEDRGAQCWRSTVSKQFSSWPPPALRLRCFHPGVAAPGPVKPR
ncbi:hypothetical protein ADK97_02555 [Streptomyces sp. H021]|nr:hypothetical protein ADK97_02555 [Streptomyces sp. H021]